MSDIRKALILAAITDEFTTNSESHEKTVAIKKA